MDTTLDLDELSVDIAARKARVVGIDGRGGSGKSTLARQLAQRCSNAVVIEMDDFCQPTADRVEQPASPGANYDCERLAAQVLEPLRSGHSGHYQRYDWDEDRLAEWHYVAADAIVLCEGVYSTSERLRSYIDYRIWVDCAYDVRLRRGVERDGERMRARWVEEWMPAEDRYVEAETPDTRADLLLDGSGSSDHGIVFTVVGAWDTGRRIEKN